MPKRRTAPIGAPCWIDLYTSDPNQSRAFYQQLFGWTAEDPGQEYGGYFNFTKDGIRVAGGMANTGEGAPDGWNVYLAVENAKATVDAAVEHGGQVAVPAMEVMALGSMAVVIDAGGAATGIWQPGEHQGFGILGEPGTPGWFELHTRAYDASVRFYRDVFHWDTHTMSDTPEFRYTTLGEGDGALAGLMDASGFLPEGTSSKWYVYFAVEDADATLRQVVELGGTVVAPAEDTPHGRLAEATDPTGAAFKLVSGG
jgi:hypothetical protein